MAGGITKLSKLRSSIPAHQRVTLRSGDESLDVMVVSLTSDIIQQIDEDTEEYCQKNKNRVNAQIRGQYFNKLLVYHCMRDVNDPSFQTKVADTPEEVSQCMELEDISRVCTAYGEIVMNRAPRIEVITENELGELKNYLETTPLSDISTVLLIHLRSCHQTIVSER